MAHSQKILILYASAGHGHEKAAKAVFETLCALKPDADAESIDTLTLAPKFFGRMYRNSYIFQIQRTPKLWGIFYHLSDLGWFYALLRAPRRLMNASVSAKLVNMLVQKNPAVIACTHFQAAEVSSHLKKRGKISSKIIVIITDYLPHRVWMDEAVDTYIVAATETRDELMRRGVAAQKIVITGIPIENKFSKNPSKAEAAADLGLEASRFTVLVTSGGDGIGLIKKIAQDLSGLKKNIQVLAVCGTNKTLFEAVSEVSKSDRSIRAFGFVNNMNELMAASDLVIGKGGGLTVSECLAMKKPMILFRSIPGQESRNAFCVEKHQAGFAIQSLEVLKGKVLEIIENPDLLRSIREGAEKMAKPNASTTIAQFLYESSKHGPKS